MGHILVVGAGVFGVTAALALRQRGHELTLLDPGPLPRPEAASTDISKVVRLDYGADEAATAWMERALEGWRAWNRAWGETLFHEDGLLVLTQGDMTEGSFEAESLATLRRRGQPCRRMDAATLSAEHPVWNSAVYTDGYRNPVGGWAASARVMARLLADADAAGVALRESFTVAELIRDDERVTGVRGDNGEALYADQVLVAAGAWTPVLLPWLAEDLVVVGQPVVHLRVDDPARWQAPSFLTFTADIARSGYYGFPALDDGTLKLARHGAGRRTHPDAPRDVSPQEIAAAREFLKTALPELGDAPIIETHLCLYCDTLDGQFWIDHDPERPGLVVAAGGSGHAFKFAPVLGELIADVVERRPNERAACMRWGGRDTPSSGDEARADRPD
jgi:glycine/D-amino acid oxidase-like deaminating enzyme